VLVLRELEGLSYMDIAARTGMTVPMVESTLLRARRRLSQEYDDIASGRRCEQVHAVVDTGGQTAFDALGLRERRRFARHIAHCQPCSRYAHAGGIEPGTRVPPLVKKIAGLLPFPFARWPFGGGGRAGGLHASGVLRPIRRATQFVHPAASLGASPATVATMAAIVIAGGGAAVELTGPDRAPGTHGAAPAASARPAAVVHQLAASSHRLDLRGGQAAVAGTPAGGRAGAARSPAAKAGKPASHTKSSRPAAPSSPTNSSPSPTAPSTSNPASPVPSIPSAPSVHLPIPLPSLPTLPPQAPKLIHQLTNPLTKVIKKLPLPGPLSHPLHLPTSPGSLGDEAGDS
jgi:hypothetical protein